MAALLKHVWASAARRGHRQQDRDGDRPRATPPLLVRSLAARGACRRALNDGRAPHHPRRRAREPFPLSIMPVVVGARRRVDRARPRPSPRATGGRVISAARCPLRRHGRLVEQHPGAGAEGFGFGTRGGALPRAGGGGRATLPRWISSESSRHSSRSASGSGSASRSSARSVWPPTGAPAPLPIWRWRPKPEPKRAWSGSSSRWGTRLSTCRRDTPTTSMSIPRWVG